jgi:hypothetical protein
MTGALTLVLWLMGGGVLGLIYFRMVQHSAGLLLSGRRGGAVVGLGLVALRLAGLAGVLMIAALQGAGPLLAAALGLLIGRFAVMRWAT